MPSYQMCTRCVMDTTDPLITFDQNGVCSHCHFYERLNQKWNLKELIAQKKLDSVFKLIKEKQKSKKYDCIIGLSGGVDSSYVAYLAHQHGLRPLCIHLDNGWNSELATYNIHAIVEKFGFDLYTHVIDWEEFRELQRAFFKASVIDIEVLSDHAIFGVIVELARNHGIKYMLSGTNFSSEAILPKAWVHRKQDLKNIKDIFKKHGQGKLKTFPQVSTLKHVFLMYGMGYKVIKPLNMIDYNKEKAKTFLMKEIGWRDYGGKHHESIFTKFYQNYILPTKFHVDKRRAHLSTLINSGQITREEALKKLEAPLYDPKELQEDQAYVLKKLNFTPEEFAAYLKAKPVPHLNYESDQFVYELMVKGAEFLKVKVL